MAAVVVAAAGAAVFVVLNKKKGSTVPAAVPASAPAHATAPAGGAGLKAVVRSTSAQHGGKAFPVGGAPVMIGRDPSACAIVFQEGTRGVSGKHCSVSYNASANVFVLTDLGSSFGTFLGSGMKLTANSPVNLKPGDIFYIGDKSNVLKVEVGQ